MFFFGTELDRVIHSDSSIIARRAAAIIITAAITDIFLALIAGKSIQERRR